MQFKENKVYILIAWAKWLLCSTSFWEDFSKMCSKENCVENLLPKHGIFLCTQWRIKGSPPPPPPLSYFWTEATKTPLWKGKNQMFESGPPPYLQVWIRHWHIRWNGRGWELLSSLLLEKRKLTPRLLNLTSLRRSWQSRREKLREEEKLIFTCLTLGWSDDQCKALLLDILDIKKTPWRCSDLKKYELRNDVLP